MFRKTLLATLLGVLISDGFAASYPLPAANRSLVGSLQYTTVSSDDTTPSVQTRYDIGYNALEQANPHLDLKRGLPFESPVVIPTQHLLPAGSREGIVINLPEMRMYYYQAGHVLTFPIGIGKIGKTIPITSTRVTRKVKNPTWVPTPAIREFQHGLGVELPKTMPPGPDNPLGPYAIYMKIPTYLIHSTIFPESIGKRASFGCIRMYEQDIQLFFPEVEANLPVVIINEPIKLAWEDNTLYVEMHHSLEEHADKTTLSSVVDRMANNEHIDHALIDWQLLAYLLHERDGVPHAIGHLLD